MKKKLTHILFLLFLLASCMPLQAQERDSIFVSLVTCSPGEQVYELFGHTAIRVEQPTKGVDVVYNYGLFNFNAPNFIYRFTKGETDYILGVESFLSFMGGYAMRNCKITAQRINMTQEEAFALCQALEVNRLPQNREYRYNFLYDNCTTRARDMIVKHIQGKVHYQVSPHDPLTFRKLIGENTQRDPWVALGINVALGAPLDKPLTHQDEMFLPRNTQRAFEDAVLIRPEGEAPLVLSEEVLMPRQEEELPQLAWYVYPMSIFLIALLVVSLLSLVEILWDIRMRWLDSLLFALYGVVGIVSFFLIFISTHPATAPNYLMFWLHPIHLFVAVAVWIKSAQKVLHYYHVVNFVLLAVFLFLWNFLPQNFSLATMPLVLILVVRSVSSVLVKMLRYRK